ncbi:MAG: tetratricopeptide repeat protein [Flavobacteriales bacterium]|nr:tetratricopeptide repeat protein [Flavobacteriales bacterium]
MLGFVVFFAIEVGLVQFYVDQFGRVKAIVSKKADKLLQSSSANFGQAEKMLEEALAIAPNDAETNLAMGRCQLNGPQRHKAVEYLLKAHKADPSVPHVTYMAAYALQLNARWKEAIVLFEEHLGSISGTGSGSHVQSR